MSALNKFNEALKTQFPELDDDIQEWITDYIEKDRKAYMENKADGKLSFGKYAGYSILELSKTEKGKDYLQWLMSQSFFSEAKFEGYHAQLKELGIKKKTLKKLAAV